MQRGVFYTPRPVVSYIVRSVDELLRTEFGLADGLADTVSWGQMAKRHNELKIPNRVSPDQAFVQILDPATGTGTILVEVIDLVYKTLVAKWRAQGHGDRKIDAQWNEYVPKHLLPRLHGYELLMAPYAIAHLKIGLKLYETGYRFGSDERARVYLTNALESARDFSGTLEFAVPALAHEAGAVNEIKRHERFTVVMGNPPYAGLSANLTEQARRLVSRFKFIDCVKIHERGALQLEKNLQDDYIKFLAYAADKLGFSATGILGIICSHGFIDNPTPRGVRWSLLSNFRRIWALDLHGNVNRGARAPDGGDDQNIFDIKDAGVTIFLGLRERRKVSTEKLISKSNVWGDRDAVKYPFLLENTYTSHHWDTVAVDPDLFLFWKISQHDAAEYTSWPKITEVFPLHSIGMTTSRDSYFMDFSYGPVLERAKAFHDSKLGDAATCEALGIPIKKGWNITRARERVRSVRDLGAHLASALSSIRCATSFLP